MIAWYWLPIVGVFSFYAGLCLIAVLACGARADQLQEMGRER